MGHQQVVEPETSQLWRFFGTNHEAETAAKQLQASTRQVLHRRYGPDDLLPYCVVVDLEFESAIADLMARLDFLGSNWRLHPYTAVFLFARQ